MQRRSSSSDGIRGRLWSVNRPLCIVCVLQCYNVLCLQSSSASELGGRSYVALLSFPSGSAPRIGCPSS